MKITEARFLRSARERAHYPVTGLPEVAFYGRSNTGKSSLINCLTGRKALAKTGARPGLTTELNWFVVNEAFCLVDLPGIGYAKLPGSQRTALAPMIEEYCSDRPALRGVFYLLDLRREPADDDLERIAWFQSLEKPVALVGTKADKLSKSDLNLTLAKWSRLLGVEREDLFATSSETGLGRDALLAVLRDLAK